MTRLHPSDALRAGDFHSIFTAPKAQDADGSRLAPSSRPSPPEFGLVRVKRLP